MKEIIFYAPIGKGSRPEHIGGAEAGCLKTMEIYRESGIKPIHINRPKSQSGLVRYIVGMLAAPIKLTALCLIHPKAVVHIVGFYNRTAAQEKLMVGISRFFRHKVIYEPRNGAMVNSFNNGSKNYKKILSYLLTKPDIVLCQGQEYVSFINEKFQTDNTCYYPNYIMDKFIYPNNLDRGKTIRLIYFGRVVPEKNIDIVIKTAGLIKKSGLNIRLDIIGGYSDEYKKRLEEIVESNNLSDSTFFLGRKPFEFIAEVLRESHYYIFPSSEINEGHSNSLTEAMGCGVVPVASTAGFNRSVCGNSDLIVSELNPVKYAEVISTIEATNRWKEYSMFCYNRVESNYTQSIVKRKLISSIIPLFNHKKETYDKE